MNAPSIERMPRLEARLDGGSEGALATAVSWLGGEDLHPPIEREARVTIFGEDFLTMMCLRPHPHPGEFIALERTKPQARPPGRAAGTARTVGQEGVITTLNLVNGIRPANWILVPPDCPRNGAAVR